MVSFSHWFMIAHFHGGEAKDILVSRWSLVAWVLIRAASWELRVEISCGSCWRKSLISFLSQVPKMISNPLSHAILFKNNYFNLQGVGKWGSWHAFALWHHPIFSKSSLMTSTARLQLLQLLWWEAIDSFGWFGSKECRGDLLHDMGVWKERNVGHLGYPNRWLLFKPSAVNALYGIVCRGFLSLYLTWVKQFHCWNNWLFTQLRISYSCILWLAGLGSLAPIEAVAIKLLIVFVTSLAGVWNLKTSFLWGC